MNETELNKIKILSHNINTPLTTILGYLSMIKKKYPEEDVLAWEENIKTEVMKVSKYSKEINEIVSKHCP